MIKTVHSIGPARKATELLGVHAPHLGMTAASELSLQRVAIAYERLPEYDATAGRAWHALAGEVRQQWKVLQEAGLHVLVQDMDPYDNAAQMFADVQRGVIRVLSTRSTGGHPFWDNTTNDLFRAVHDVLGHAATGRGFDRHGEARAYQHHAETFSPLARMALATELRGQAAALAMTGEFPAQKIAILPREIRELSLTRGDVDDQADALYRHAAGGLKYTIA